MPKEEQVKRINESFNEKNKKLLGYISQLILKNFVEMMNFIGSFIFELKNID